MKFCLIALVSIGAIALAQRPGPRWKFHAKVVANAPYSGVGVTTTKRTLSDGNTINESNCVKVYRDASGRTRREQTRNSATCSVTPESIQIYDPVAGVEYAINVQKNTYRQFTIKTSPGGTTAPTATRPANPNQIQTSLGTQPIPGTSLTAQGTQIVTTIPPGKFGNAQPVTITSVRWYSPDLQIVIQSSRTDPRNGTRTYQLNGISTTEPAESLFQLPSGLTLEQGSSHANQNGRGRHAL